MWKTGVGGSRQPGGKAPTLPGEEAWPAMAMTAQHTDGGQEGHCAHTAAPARVTPKAQPSPGAGHVATRLRSAGPRPCPREGTSAVDSTVGTARFEHRRRPAGFALTACAAPLSCSQSRGPEPREGHLLTGSESKEL